MASTLPFIQPTCAPGPPPHAGQHGAAQGDEYRPSDTHPPGVSLGHTPCVPGGARSPPTGPALMPLAPSPGPGIRQEDRPTEVTIASRPPLGAQQLLRDHCKSRGLFKRTLSKRTGSADPCRVASLSSKGLGRSDQQGTLVQIRVVTSESQWAATSVRMPARFTARIHADAGCARQGSVWISRHVCWCECRHL